MKIRGVVATAEIDSDGESFSAEALRQIADSAAGKPLTFVFQDEIGRVLEGHYADGCVSITAEVDAALPPFQVED